MIEVEAPKCKDGKLRNYKSVVAGEVIEWKDGIAEVTESVWEELKSLGGFKKIGAKGNIENIDTNNEAGKTESEINIPTLTNSVSEIRAFANNHNIPLGKAQTKEKMLAIIKKYYSE